MSNGISDKKTRFLTRGLENVNLHTE